MQSILHSAKSIIIPQACNAKLLVNQCKLIRHATYREVTGRTVGVNYTNTGNKPIFVSIIFNNQNSIYRTVSIDNNPIITINGTPEADQPGAVTFIVPIQSSYKVETNGSVNKWIELS